MDKLVIISDAFAKNFEKAEIPFEVINSSGDKNEDWEAALSAGADYIFYADCEAELSTGLLTNLWKNREKNPLVMGKSQGGFTGWLMKMLASYFCQVFIDDACPPFVFARRDKIEEALNYIKKPLKHADAVLACNAAYRQETVEWVECKGDNKKAGSEAGNFLSHIFKAYPAYQHAGENMMKEYADNTENVDRGRKTGLDKLLGLVNHEIVSYVFFGVLTTVVSVGTYAIFRNLLGTEVLFGEHNYILANIISWVFAVLFAFFTNKLFVFNSRTWKTSIVVKEFSSFVTARLVSLLIDTALMFLFVDLIHMGDMWAKILVQVVVVILNYLFSKLFIFKNRKK